MPLPVVASTAAAVVSALNGGTFSQSFTAERSYADWELPLEDADLNAGMLVDVVPVPTSEMDLETRGSLLFTPEVDIIVRRRLGQDFRETDGKYSVAKIDALVWFVEELARFFVMGEVGSARWQSSEPRRWWVPTHLHKHHQFTGIVRLTFERSVTT